MTSDPRRAERHHRAEARRYGESGPGSQPESHVATLEELIELRPLVSRVVNAIVRDVDLAEDVTQEAISKAWSHLDQFRGDAPFKYWVVGIARNAARSALRRRLSRPTAAVEWNEVETPAPSPDRMAAGRLMADDLWAALGELAPMSRAIVVLRELEGMSYEEIAEVLDVPVATVRTRLFRSRRFLAERLQDWR